MKHFRQDTEIEAVKAAVIQSVAQAIEAAEHFPGGQDILGQVLCGALETVGGGAPRYEAFGDKRADARWWAETASPVDLELHVGEGLRAMTRKTFAEQARKRVFWMLWETFSPDQQAAFLAKVRPP